jgi:hypothetical protein
MSFLFRKSKPKKIRVEVDFESVDSLFAIVPDGAFLGIEWKRGSALVREKRSSLSCWTWLTLLGRSLDEWNQSWYGTAERFRNRRFQWTVPW